MKKIPPFRLMPVPLTEDAKNLPKFSWAARGTGTRHRIGGEPERSIAANEWPVCPGCKQPTTFYGQLDSINDEYCIADAGLLYVFVCFDCIEAQVVIDTP